MNKLSLYITITFIMVLSVSIEASNIERGKDKSVAIEACHGQAGVSRRPIVPTLAVQHER